MSFEGASEEHEEAHDAINGTIPDSSQPNTKKRPPDRKQAKEKLKNEEDVKTYVLAMRALIAASKLAALNGGFSSTSNGFDGAGSGFGGEFGGGGNGGGSDEV
uniref:Uncharacterized protein n=1 Tax=Leersia perrieri TaxID=77586 RepID=A0A0D9XPW6_9ORYZ